MAFVIRMTHSQQMALLDLIADYMRSASATEVFINVSQFPAIETRPEDLLRLVQEAEWQNEEPKHPIN